MNQNNRGPSGGPNMSQQAMNSLLGMAGQKLGKNPQQLRQQIEGGQVKDLLGNLDPQKAAQVNQLLNNPQQLEQFLNSPQVKGLLGKLMQK